MRNVSLACLLTIMPGCAAAQQPSQSNQSTRQDGVVESTGRCIWRREKQIRRDRWAANNYGL